MHEAAAELRFEYAARLRDEVKELDASCAKRSSDHRTPVRPALGSPSWLSTAEPSI